MRRLVVLLIVVLVGLSPLSPRIDAQTSKKERPKPKAMSSIPGYKKHILQGFTLLIQDEVYKHNDDSTWKRKPLDVLELELSTIVRSLPERAVKALQRLLIWVEWEDRADPDLEKGVVAKYYGVMGNLTMWSLGKGKHALKANNIEIINMRSLTREHQPDVKTERCVILHEMAHAVHHQVIGFRNPQVSTAYRQAMARGLYDEAKDVYGRTLRPPYAARNEHEYFAEITCAYLDKLHYFPFNADDLKKHDPTGYRTMEQVWGTRKKIETSLRAKTEIEATRRFNQARALYAVGKPEAARQALEILVDKFADTKAGPSAVKWLKQIEKELKDKPPAKK